MASSLLALLDDIATILDDVAVLTKIAAKKTAGVLGDDLALNAQQVAGVDADRELPVVWAVAKGSMMNKVILVPAALLISAIAPWAVIWLLMIGGLFLCYEGFEKIAHRLLHSRAERAAHHAELLREVIDGDLDIVALEKDKIKGAIRTDFILSAEIIVISLGTVADKDFLTRLTVLSLIAVVMTVGVYGLVGAIVKIDDVGLFLSRRRAAISRWIGSVLLGLAPRLMRLLTIAGTAAMFLVGGGILAHGIGPIHHAIDRATSNLSSWSAVFMENGANGLLGLVAGGLALAVVAGISRLRTRFQRPS